MCLGLFNAYPLHEPTVLLRCQGFGFCFRPWPLERTGLKPLVKQHKSLAFPVQRLDPVPTSATEKKQGIGKEVQFKLLLYNINSAL